ncbi:MAG: pilus assembly protein PilM [Candidatus Omnitrophota bacterium]
MASGKRLGIYAGSTGFTLVQVVNDAPFMSVFVPFAAINDIPSANRKMLSEDMLILETLQKAIRNNGFAIHETSLAIPSRDIIIRWFTIPWMKSSEIQNIVVFEAKKYIPFDLDDLLYTYYPANMAGSNPRQIGIIFIAIRKNIFEKYSNTLIQAGMNLVFSEPASMGLLRTLVFRKVINPEQLTAIVHVDGYTGELLICEKGYVKFTREFNCPPLAAPGTGTVIQDDQFRPRVFNEIRMSFEFFLRQYGGEDVKKLVAISVVGNKSFWDGMCEEVGIDAEVVDVSYLVDRADAEGVSAVYAYGAAMVGKVLSVIDFNLFEGSKQQVSLKQVEVESKTKELVFPVVMGIGCFIFIFGLFFMADRWLNGLRTEIAVLERKIGVFLDMDVEEADAQTIKKNKQLHALESLPLSARTSKLLTRLVKRMPAGFYLSSYNVTYKDIPAKGEQVKDASDAEVEYYLIKTKVVMTFTGVAALNDNNMEFEMINKFFNTLTADNMFRDYFSRLKIASLQIQEFHQVKATGFTISCEEK